MTRWKISEQKAQDDEVAACAGSGVNVVVMVDGPFVTVVVVVVGCGMWAKRLSWRLSDVFGDSAGSCPGGVFGGGDGGVVAEAEVVESEVEVEEGRGD